MQKVVIKGPLVLETRQLFGELASSHPRLRSYCSSIMHPITDDRSLAGLGDNHCEFAGLGLEAGLWKLVYVV